MYRGYSATGINASTAGQAFYTPNTSGRISAGGRGEGDNYNTRRRFQGRRMMTTTGQTVRYREDRAAGRGVQYGNQVLVSRRLQYSAIRNALGMIGG